MTLDIKQFAPPQVRNDKDPQSAGQAGFTLIELLISVSLFATVIVLFSSVFVQSVRISHEANAQNQIYEDARYLMQRIAQEVRNGMIDYDEYYAQNIVIPSGSEYAKENFGRNYGRYYSSFYNPGADKKLGFDCNDGSIYKSNCIMKKNTKDKNTGQNPFEGKIGNEGADKENAFCGAVSYEITDGTSPAGTKTGKLPDGTDICPAQEAAKTAQHELYLISADGRTKTIFAREKIGADKDGNSMYALSFLRMKGEDLKGEDGVPDTFTCDDKFVCTGDSGGSAGCTEQDLPASREIELNSTDDVCDTKDLGFSKDFVPISPFRANIAGFDVYISPAENSQYAFSENQEEYSSRAKIVLTLEPNPNYFSTKKTFEPITISETIYAGVLNKIPAAVLVE